MDTTVKSACVGKPWARQSRSDLHAHRFSLYQYGCSNVCTGAVSAHQYVLAPTSERSPPTRPQPTTFPKVPGASRPIAENDGLIWPHL